MHEGPALALALTLLMISFPGMPSGSAGPSLSPSGLTPDSGASQSFHYVPSAEDAGAFFFRFHTQDAACVLFEISVTMAPFPRMPFLRTIAHGRTYHLPGTGDVDVLSDWTGSGYFDNDAGTSHVMFNATAMSYYNETGYDEQSPAMFGRLTSGTCASDTEPTDRWVSFVVAAPVRNATVRLSFFEAVDKTDPLHPIYFPGNATGTIAYSAESNRTFLKQLKDFHGTASANGDPLDHGAGPSATAANVEVTVPTMRGFAGGFLDFAARPGQNEASALSYQGPGGEAGAGTDVAPGSPVPKALLLHIAGSAGDWRFRAHAYAAPRSFSSLMVWGADIETGTPNPTLDRADADRDGVPDDAEGAICYVQDDNRDLDGRCPNPPDYEPTAGLPSPRRL